MSAFRRIDDGRPLRLVQVGAGGMGRTWLRTIAANPDVELVGLVDLNLDTAHAALAEAGLQARDVGGGMGAAGVGAGDAGAGGAGIDGGTDAASAAGGAVGPADAGAADAAAVRGGGAAGVAVVVGTSVSEVAAATGADAVVNVTVPVAHLPVNREALAAGLPVLCEKPAAPSIAEAYRQAAAASVHGELLMISQSRRYFAALDALRAALPALGPLGTVVTEFYKAPHFPGFREEMDHVLLIDMAIHQFDVARAIVDDEPVAVYCEEHNPQWSWFRGAANAHAVFEFANGVRYVFTGSWCAPGDETAWNGQWRVSGAHGTVRWDGAATVTAHLPDEEEAPREVPVPSGVAEETAGALTEFVACLRSGEAPANEALQNVQSLAMVESAVRSAESGTRVRIADVLAASLAEAIAAESDPDVRAELERLAG